MSQGDKARAQRAADKAISLRESYHDRIVELLVELTGAQVRAPTGHADDRSQAEDDLQKLIQEATRRGFSDYALQARLALGELEMLSNAAGGRRSLEALQKESSEKGFGLIAQKAAQILNQAKNPVQISQSRMN